MKTDMKYYLQTTFLTVLSLFLFSCGGGGGGDEKESTASEVSEFTEAEQQIVQDIDKVIHELPPPSEVPFLLEAVGSDFNADLLNSLDKIEAYQNTNDKAALNLGVYATDAGYLSSYEQVQDALKYMEACHKLAETIGISSAFDISMMKRFEKNLGNRDSLSVLINEAVRIAEQRLESGDRLTMAGLVLCGSYIEGLYISTQLVDSYPTDLSSENRTLILEPLVKIILDQKIPLIDVIGMLKDLPQDDVIANMITELGVLRILYQDLQEVQIKIEENTGDYTLDPGVLDDITTEVERIRTEIVS